MRKPELLIFLGASGVLFFEHCLVKQSEQKVFCVYLFLGDKETSTRSDVLFIMLRLQGLATLRMVSAMEDNMDWEGAKISFVKK